MIQQRKSNKIFAIMALFCQLAVCLLYGFFFKIPSIPASKTQQLALQPISFMYIALMLFLVIIGFGLLITSTGRMNYSGIGFCLLMVCFTIESYFLFTAFWSKSSIQKTPNTFGVRDYNFFLSYIEDKQSLGSNLGEAIKCALSMIVVLSILIGRICPLQMLVISVIGSAVYELARQINIEANGNEFGSMKIFLFGGAFGMGLSFIFKSRQGEQTMNHNNHKTKKANGTLSLIGLLIVLSLFPVLTFESSQLGFHSYVAALNVIYGIAGSSLTSLCISLVSGGNKYLVLGSISGGVSVLSASAYIVSPVYAIVIGIISAFIQYWLIRFSDFLQSSVGVFDSFGCLVFLVHGFMGSVWATVHEAITRGNSAGFPFVDAANNIDFFGKLPVYNFGNGWITLGIGLSGGLILGIMLVWVNLYEWEQFFTDKTLWKDSLTEMTEMTEERSKSKQELKEEKISEVHEIIFNKSKRIENNNTSSLNQPTSAHYVVELKSGHYPIKGQNEYL